MGSNQRSNSLKRTKNGHYSITRRQFLAGAGTTSALLALGSSGGLSSALAADLAQPVGPNPLNIPTADDLRETGDLQSRWLGLPLSRLVVNPYNSTNTQPPLQYSIGPNIPLNAAYWAADYPWEMDNLLTLYRKEQGKTGTIDIAYEDDFSGPQPGWIPSDGLDVEYVNGQLKLTNTDSAPIWYGTFSRWVELDLDKTPYLQISVTSLADAWGLRLKETESGSEITVQGDSNNTGLYTYNLAQITGWSGTRRFEVIIRVAIKNKPATFDSFRMLGANPVLEGAASFDTSWLPYELPISAQYGTGSKLDNHDFFYDENTLMRSSTISPAPGDNVWTIAGHFSGDAFWDASKQVLTITTDNHSYAVAFSASVSSATLYPTLLELLANTNPLQGNGPEGYWTVDLDLSQIPNSGVTVTVAFATQQEGGVDLATRKALAAARRKWTVSRDAQRRFWNGVLRDVPHPHSFELQGVDYKGATSDDIRLTYYKAWTFLVADSLPSEPEVGYPYPQIAAGKPSLWKGGATKARATAAWDSLFGMQFLAYYDPDTAWESFKGLMSLVEADGTLGGESLPSRKAQTAMVLYQVTGDTRPLKSIYPALKRLLLWERKNRRWIQPGHHDNPCEAGSGFTSELIIDMGYARKIANILAMPDEEMFWDTQRHDLFQVYLQEFWATPTSRPSQGYNLCTGQRGSPFHFDVCEGLHVGLWKQEMPQLQGLIDLFRSHPNGWDPNFNFVKSPIPKYPGMSYMVYGLLDQGLPEPASVTANEVVRDVTRAGMFAEVYYIWSNPPVPQGVRPSLFGVGFAIDFVWMMNGYRMDQGWPNLVRLNGTASGGMSNLKIRGKTLNLRINRQTDTVELSGSFVREGKACGEVKVAAGQTVPVSRKCTTGEGV